MHHPYIAAILQPPKGPALARVNQLLVGASAKNTPAVQKWLEKNEWQLLTDASNTPVTLLSGLTTPIPPSVHDVYIYEHELVQPASGTPMVFTHVQELREVLKRVKGAPLPANQISPNHALISAPFESSCPDGPPIPTPQAPPPPQNPPPPQTAPPPQAPPPPPEAYILPHKKTPRQSITVIDSGWQWDPENWGANPLGPIGPEEWVVDEIEAEWPAGSYSWQSPGQPPYVVAEALTTQTGWQPGTPDTPGEFIEDSEGGPLIWSEAEQQLVGTREKQLVALAGHANFIAGMIAQTNASAAITIRNFNGAFQPASQCFPDEIAVARALIKSVTAGAQIISLGFAFWPLDGLPSCVWETAFQLIAPQKPVVFAPAGNQSVNCPRYPAALNTPDATSDWSPPKKTFESIIGVGSIDPPANPEAPDALTRSKFSNFGPWVSCATVGSKVTSTFLHVNMALEEEPPTENGQQKQNFEANNWAMWNGTSFSTPTMAAMTLAAMTTQAETTAEDVSATEALQKVLTAGTSDPELEMGKLCPNT